MFVVVVCLLVCLVQILGPAESFISIVSEINIYSKMASIVAQKVQIPLADIKIPIGIPAASIMIQISVYTPRKAAEDGPKCSGTCH